MNHALNDLQKLFYEMSGHADDGLLLISPENRRYLTSFPCTDSYLAICRDAAVFFTDSRYIEAAKESISACPCVEYQDIDKELLSFFQSHQVKKVHIEAKEISVDRFHRLAKNLSPLELPDDSSLDDAVQALRKIKTDTEIRHIIDAQRIAEATFQRVLSFIQPGKTEKEIALFLDYDMLSHGAEAISFETIAVSGANTSKPHGVPTDKKIEVGDFVTMDFGAVVNGMHSDMTRTVAVGKVSEKQRAVYQIVLEAKNTAEGVIREGLSCADADAAARKVIEKNGYGEYFRHSTGHGVGLEIHEAPNLSFRSKDTLTRGNVVTVEPGIYLPSLFGVRVEDMVVVNEKGCQRLTEAPEELILV